MTVVDDIFLGERNVGVGGELIEIGKKNVGDVRNVVKMKNGC